MELRDYIRVLRKRWRFIVLLAVLAVAGAVAASLLATPQYEARTQLFVSTQASGSAGELLQGSNFTQQRVKSYATIMNTPAVLQPVIDDLDLDVTPAQLAQQVSAEAPLDTVLINVSVRDESPEQAAAIANAVGAAFAELAAGQLEEPGADGRSPVRISTVDPADPPSAPVSPDLRLNLALGLLVGLALGIGAAVLRETLDTSVRGEDDVRQVTDASVLGGIAWDEEAPSRPLIVQASPQSTRSEAFRQLRTNLQFVDVANHPRSIVVTSSVPGEGKSTTVANLAITMAAAGTRVCLVEADLRRPKVTDYMGVDRSVGLTTVLIGQADLDDVLQPWGRNELYLLPSGQVPPNPSELLGSAAMDKLLRRLEDTFDVVIIDAPPLLPVTDAAVLAKLADGAVVIVGSQKVNRDQLGKALSNLETVGARVLGVVLNLLPTKGPDAYSYYSYGYASYDEKSTGSPPPSGRSHASPRRARR
ncbi:MAG: polysaccharide biosynthesis tyrosine autokinase [Actinomycetes bacterium]